MAVFKFLESGVIDSKPFIKKDFVILQKNDVYFDLDHLQHASNKIGYKSSLDLIEKMNSDDEGVYGCHKFSENEFVYIYKCL